MSTTDCIFCKLVAGEIPSYTIWENDSHMAILNLWPNTPGYCSVLAKQHLPSYFADNTDEAVSDLLVAAKQVVKLIDKNLEDVSRCGVVFEGFGVDHLHVQVSPMHGTADMESWQPIDGQKRDEFYEVYPGYISTHNCEQASDKELAAMAAKIRGEA